MSNKSTYNIRVANLSLHAASRGSLFFDPLDQAVEKLWLNGVVVVAAAGNYATNGQESGVPFAPGNDPFVITVGASDIQKKGANGGNMVYPVKRATRRSRAAMRQAGGGNRTLIASLEGWSSTIELHPRAASVAGCIRRPRLSRSCR